MTVLLVSPTLRNLCRCRHRSLESFHCQQFLPFAPVSLLTFFATLHPTLFLPSMLLDVISCLPFLSFFLSLTSISFSSLFLYFSLTFFSLFLLLFLLFPHSLFTFSTFSFYFFPHSLFTFFHILFLLLPPASSFNFSFFSSSISLLLS